MRTILILVLLLLPVPAMAQAPDVTIPAEATWVGPLLFRDSRGDLAMPTRVDLTISDNTVTGRWIALTKRASGDITGTIKDNGRIEFVATLYGGGEITTITGNREITGLEACQAEARFEGHILQGGVFRFTAGRTNPRDGLHQCETLTRLTWYLQLDP